VFANCAQDAAAALPEHGLVFVGGRREAAAWCPTLASHPAGEARVYVNFANKSTLATLVGLSAEKADAVLERIAQERLFADVAEFVNFIEPCTLSEAELERVVAP
jgi:hypothetical protein